MPKYAALIYEAVAADLTTELSPEDLEVMKEYDAFGQAAAAIIRGGDALYPSSTATTVTVTGGKGGEVVTTDGPFAETKEVLTGFYIRRRARRAGGGGRAVGVPPAPRGPG